MCFPRDTPCSRDRTSAITRILDMYDCIIEMIHLDVYVDNWSKCLHVVRSIVSVSFADDRGISYFGNQGNPPAGCKCKHGSQVKLKSSVGETPRYTPTDIILMVAVKKHRPDSFIISHVMTLVSSKKLIRLTSLPLHR